ncbi:flagellar basal body P-ring formation chaperone FlgA [Candidatus Colwellia aromaticivorans]|uniref:flagellar basal body P-ring formation chaperone FlgA n=1 Tax=Candidatus Colwellia aromaticivorans TaxID=2267621 RepID=UPI000DF27651|nr:flagellar basal body P-ring formation chaperone FlgA [Candidatus Colwellia aromaticivorans]
MFRIKLLSITLYLIVLISPISQSTTWDKAYIETFAKKYLEEKLLPPVGGKISIRIANIDPRITIKPCQQKLIANIPENTKSRNVNVKISCADSTPWKIYLPARIEKTFAVVIATTTIEKGATLSNNNISLQYLASNKIRGKKMTDVTTILGSKAEKRIGKGRAINTKNVCLVCKGDSVTITAKSPNFIIKTQGVALSSGNLNKQIKVKNTRSGRIISSKVTAINQVVIHL